jgi:hypothetical protein
MSEKDPIYTPQQSEDFDLKYDQGQFNAYEIRQQLGVIAVESTDEQITDPEQEELQSETIGYPGRNPYKSKNNSGKHPIPVSSRLRGIGEEGEGKAEALYGPLKKTS